MRLCLIAVVAWAALAVALPAAADAAAPPEGGAAEKHRPGEVKEGLFKGALDLTLWTVVVFLVLFFVLRSAAWKPIAEGLDRREQAIARDKHEAEAARAEATRLREENQAEKARANDQIRQMMDKARQDAEALAAEREAAGKAALAADRERLYRDLGVAKDQALNQIWTQTVQLAALISTKAVGRELSEADHRKLLDESLAEFRQALAGRREDLESARA